jgi:predicted ATPase/DNA-binding CsgD family transcriptional regulator
MVGPKDIFQPPAKPLTAREQEVLTLIGEGLSNRAISEQLVVALSTVKWYIRQIFKKLGVDGRGEAVASGRHWGLLGPEPASRKFLPGQPTPFIGRKVEVDDLVNILSEPGSRLVTILGPGGIGKTRLAIEVARKLQDTFSDGAYFVPLASVKNPDRLVNQVAKAVGFTFFTSGTVKAGEEDAETRQLFSYLREKQLLLVLDNAEQLLTGEVADPPIWNRGLESFIAYGLEQARGVSFLVTSRQSLNLLGESVFLLQGLQVQAPKQGVFSRKNHTSKDHLAAFSDALLLFEHSARRARPGFSISRENIITVIKICRLVEGLPLGIELAAAWSSVISLEEISREVESNLDFLESDKQNIPIRQRSIRSIFEAMWQRLSESEQQAFQGMTVFKGGFTAEAALAILEVDRVVLVRLAEKALIQKKFSGRFQIHELFRQFGAEKLQDPDEIWQKHAVYFTDLAVQAGNEVRGDRAQDWYMWLEAESENLKAIMDWSLNGEFPIYGLLLIGPLSYLNYYQGIRKEYSPWISLALEKIDAAPPQLRGRVLLIAGIWEYNFGRPEISQNLLREALALYKTLKLEIAEGNTLTHLAMAAHKGAENPSEVLKLAREGMAVFEKHDHIGFLALSHDIQGEIYRSFGDLENARIHYEASLGFTKKTSELPREAALEANLGLLSFLELDYKEAFKRHRQALLIAIDIRSKINIAVYLAFLAGAIAGLGHPVQAAEIFGAVDRELENLGQDRVSAVRPETEEYISLTQEMLGKKEFEEAYLKGCESDFQEVLSISVAKEKY